MSQPTVIIDTLAFGGSGVCRIHGKVCFVPFSCPGDEVRLAVTTEKRSYLLARITELVVASPFRITPPCPLFGSCGGCFWQHIEYSHQLAAKKQILGETLWRGARVESDCIVQTVPSVLQYGYRCRVQFRVQYSSDQLKVGFYRLGTHKVVDIPPEGCPVAMPVINQALNSLRKTLSAFQENRSITDIRIECTEPEVVAVITYTGRDKNAVRRFFLDHRAELMPVTGIFLQQPRSDTLQKVYGDDEMIYSLPAAETDLPSCQLSYKPGGFSQVNRYQNSTLLAHVRRMGNFQADDQVLDLFCGNGNFSLPIAGQVGHITGIEESRVSIDAALRNCRLNRFDNTEFICDDAVTSTRRLADSGRQFDAVILDPPRAGAAEVIVDVCRLNPDKIIYISCDPCTLARDCALLAAGGYCVEQSVPVDMFPQTYHIESITLLCRR